MLSFLLSILGVPPHLINATVKGIMAQRLVKVLCPICKKKVPTNKDWWQSMTKPYNAKMPSHVYEAVGCEDCKNSGYKGRMSIYELVIMTDKLRALVQPKVELQTLVAAAKGSFLPLRLNAASKVIQGHTSIEEVLRVIV